MRLFLPQFQEYRMLQTADRALNVEALDEAFAKLAALINGNLDGSNLSKTASFPNTAFLEPNSILTFRGIHSAAGSTSAITPAAPTSIVMGSIPTVLNAALVVPVSVSGMFFYSTAPASTPTFTVSVGGTTVAAGTTSLVETVTSYAEPKTSQHLPNPGVWWKFGDDWDPWSNYADDPGPASTQKYKLFTNFFSGGVTPVTGDVVKAAISPSYPDMESYIEITFKTRHVA